MPEQRKTKLRQADLAKHLDMSVRNLRDLIAAEVFKEPTDSLTLDGARTDYIRHMRKQAAGREKSQAPVDASIDPDVKLALLREEYIQLAVIKKRKALEELIERRDMVLAVSSAFARVKSVLLRVPKSKARELAALADEAEVREKLDGCIKEALDELASTPVEHIGTKVEADDIDLGTDDLEEGD